MENIIKIEKLTKIYKKKVAKDSYLYKDEVVLNNINLDIKKGKINAIVGKSGAGKTTLLKLILNMTSKNSGKMFFEDEEITEESCKYLENIGYFMGSDFYNDLTVKENLEWYCKFYGFHVTEEIERWLKKLKLEKYINREIDGLSKGTLQKIALARAMLTSPKVLILDEPFNFIDYEEIAYIRELIAEINETMNTTVIITSHAIKELELIAHNVILLDKGKVIDEIDVEEMKRSFNNIIVLKCDDTAKALMLLERELKINTTQLTRNKEILIRDYDNIGTISKLLVENNINILSIKSEEMSLEKYLILRREK